MRSGRRTFASTSRSEPLLGTLATQPPRPDAEGLAKTVFETLRTEPTVCLVPEFDDADDGKLLLAEYWRTIFELMLES